MALGDKSPRETREANTTTVRNIATGSVLAVTDRRFTQPWGAEKWVCDQVAINFDTDPDNDIVESVDTDEGRFYSINGKPVAYVEGEYEPLFEMLQAAE
jgi:hypothetical protein